jgi:hypothetical protein
MLSTWGNIDLSYIISVTFAFLPLRFDLIPSAVLYRTPGCCLVLVVPTATRLRRLHRVYVSQLVLPGRAADQRTLVAVRWTCLNLRVAAYCTSILHAWCSLSLHFLNQGVPDGSQSIRNGLPPGKCD